MNLNKDKQLREKGGYMYYQDNNGIIFCDQIDQSNMVGGGNEQPRNIEQNPMRLERIKRLKENPLVLDFGCGNGMLVDFLTANGVQAHGYDEYSDKHNQQPLFNHYDIVVMVEVIEHLYTPFKELDNIYRWLKPGGVVMIETSFTDWLTIEDSYIEPAVGHHCVFSHAGLTQLMVSKGFTEMQHENQNVRYYQKN